MNRIILLAAFLTQTPQPAAESFTQSVINALPTWEKDTLAQFEYAELLTVQQDIENSVSEEQLRADWTALVALDTLLAKRRVI